MNRLLVFTDGAAKGNPGPGGWGAIIVTPDGMVTELGGGSAHTTNNKMELSGAIAALEYVADLPGPVAIYTDSTYLIQGITQWVWGWRKKGWRTAAGSEVLNRDLWERLLAATSARGANRAGSKDPASVQGVEWHWVRGHVGTAGNERCDEIAVAFALQQPPALYRGPLSGYAVDVHTVPDDTGLPKRDGPAGLPKRDGPAGLPKRDEPAGLPKRDAASSGRNGGKSAAHSYLSVVDGIPMRHATWAECERRVKGRSGARYKKTTSAADEAAILREWGVALDR